MQKISRRKIIKLSALGSIVSALGLGNSFAKGLALMPTPGETEGPFYPVQDQADKDADLTQIVGHAGNAQGQHILVTGQVMDVTGNAVENALLDIWQADANGRYRHPRDPNTAKLDENFQGRAIVVTDKNGQFRLKTVMPGAYLASRKWIRPPHIHFKISKQGYRALTTQMYFPDEALNKTDLLLQVKSVTERAAMIARKLTRQGELPVYGYNIVLELSRT